MATPKRLPLYFCIIALKIPATLSRRNPNASIKNGAVASSLALLSFETYSENSEYASNKTKLISKKPLLKKDPAKRGLFMLNKKVGKAKFNKKGMTCRTSLFYRYIKLLSNWSEHVSVIEEGGTVVTCSDITFSFDCKRNCIFTC